MAMRLQLAQLARKYRRVDLTPALPLLAPVHGDLIIDGLASPATIDREHTKFASYCWTPIPRSVPLLYRHDKNRVAGEILRLEATEAGLRVQARVTDPDAKRCQGLSVAATVQQYRIYHEDDPERFHSLVISARLDEISLTPEPANVQAIARPLAPVLAAFDFATAGISKMIEIVEVLRVINHAQSVPPAVLKSPAPVKLPKPKLQPCLEAVPHRLGAFGALISELEKRNHHG